MTTDTIVKEAAVRFEIDGVPCSMGGIAKGSGMIHPNMATMLIFITCDALITPELLGRALREDVKTSFNMISIDGDTSTNDMAVILSNGMAGNAEISTEGAAYDTFCRALHMLTVRLSRIAWQQTGREPRSCWNAAYLALRRLKPRRNGKIGYLLFSA